MNRWPVIRHLRWLYMRLVIEREERIWRALGGPPVDIDFEAIDAIWRGES